MNKLLSDVLEFHRTYNQPVLSEPTIPSEDRCELRVKLIAEELQEFKDAIEAKDIVAVADALTDLLYVVNGAVLEFGLKDKIDKCHDEVQASNMSKLGEDGKPIYREDGKVVKGPNFFEPDLASIVHAKEGLTFENIPLRSYFKCAGELFFKQTEQRAITQEVNVSDRTTWEFTPTTRVEVA